MTEFEFEITRGKVMSVFSDENGELDIAMFDELPSNNVPASASLAAVLLAGLSDSELEERGLRRK